MGDLDLLNAEFGTQREYLGEPRLYLGELEPHPLHLDLRILATDEDESPVRSLVDQVARFESPSGLRADPQVHKCRLRLGLVT